MEPEIAAFARRYTAFVEAMASAATGGPHSLSPLGERVAEFLGVPLSEVDPITEQFPPHQVVDLDLALEHLTAEHGGERIGVSGLHRAHLESFAEFLYRSHVSFEVGPISYTRVPAGPDRDRRVVAFGIALLRIDGVPLVWLQRGANRQYGREYYTVEVLCPELAVAERCLERLRTLMRELSVLRGQIISFHSDDFDYRGPGFGLRFLARPEVSAEDVVLPPGVLDRITRHVVEIGRRSQVLRDAGQHLKRGILLYGPPGTGKTHVIRHLLTRTPETTAVLLSGRTLPYLGEATKLARATQPAIIVLEDCDLVAEERGGDTNAALFETLEAMDGLDGDADITFILTTNRPDLLERALVERPGRVDLAVHIDKPDLAGRRQLFALYARQLVTAEQLSPAALESAAERTDGITASFTKEAIRRCVVRAAQHGRPPGDADLDGALEEMLSDAETFTRILLGGGDLTRADPYGLGEVLDDQDGGRSYRVHAAQPSTIRADPPGESSR